MKAKRKNKMRGRVVPDEYERQGLLDDSDDGENPDRHSANLRAAMLAMKARHDPYTS